MFAWKYHILNFILASKSAAVARTTGFSILQSHLRRCSILNKKKMSLSDEEAKKACVPPPQETEGFFFQQTMIRIKEPKRSLDFYSRVMGMTLLLKLDFPAMDFSLYFMGYENPDDVPSDPKERAKFCFSRKATLELTHNHGTEKEEKEVYHNGNSDPRGFGHIGIVVPDVYKACERFEQLGVPFIKKPDAGKMKGLAFIQDPDGYWIEILNPVNMSGSL
ncbi:unnamed protein product [Lymnaea stagnalis]|uniref:lactoylglutathione lyase n=1 Tax=Lymnaea stagnalis TaxID=6523 RepID=A0AAV2I1B4_LYMST